MPAPQPGSSPDPAADPADRIGLADVQAAQRRLGDQVRHPPVSRLTDPAIGGTVYLMHEYLQHTGSFKARGALNLTAAYRQRTGLPAAGLAIASGGNAGLAAAWAARAAGVPATVFVPVTVPAMKLAQLHRYGAEVRQVGSEYAEALQASQDHAEQSGALLSHAYDNPLIAAGAGSCASEVLAQLPDLDTIVVAVGGGGLLAGTIAATELTGCRVLAVEPEHCQALAAALQAGGPVDVRPVSVAADSLGARRVSRRPTSWPARRGSGRCWSPTRRSWPLENTSGNIGESWSSTVVRPRWRHCCPAATGRRRTSGSQSCSAARTPIRPT